MLKITIITICYNEEKKIKETIDSVCQQKYSNIEYIIIDGASTDGTLDILKKYIGFKNISIYSEKDSGIYNAMNCGITYATGDYIFFLNAGDIFFNNHVVADVVSCIEKNMKAIFYGDVCYADANGSKIVQDFSKEKGSLEKKMLEGKMPCHQGIFVPGELLKIRPFREEYKIRADFEWLMYWVSKGYSCIHIPVVISYYDSTGVSSRFKNFFLREKEGKLIIDQYQMEMKKNLLQINWEHEANQWRHVSQKHFFMFRIMDLWMSLVQRNIKIENYLLEKGYREIAIYGMSYIGQRLLGELKESEIKIKYAIDKNVKELSADVMVYLPTDRLSKVDAVIVTAVMYYNEIKMELKDKVWCPILSFEDLLYEMAEQ